MIKLTFREGIQLKGQTDAGASTIRFLDVSPGCHCVVYVSLAWEQKVGLCIFGHKGGGGLGKIKWGRGGARIIQKGFVSLLPIQLLLDRSTRVSYGSILKTFILMSQHVTQEGEGLVECLI